ncbi:MAG: hypothetical protein ACXAB7_18235 [Candidatus Kariarchaeaceae archaeon]|jgi:cytoskeletal protein CcmA (bactofilin family)
MEMKRTRKLIYNEDTTLNEEMDLRGSLEVFGNLTVPSIKLKGNLNVTGSIQVGKSMEINGSVNIHSDLVVKENLQVRGSCQIGGITQAHSIWNKGEFTTDSVKARIVILSVGTNGLNIKNDIKASESISINIGHKDQYLIGGTIGAPTITLRYRALYTKWSTLPAKIFGLFNKKPRFKRKIVIKNLRIKTEHLILKSVYNEDESTFIFDDDCEIDAKIINQVRYNI